MSKKIFMIAGPNGAGKTTMAQALMSGNGSIIDEFINADEIARGLAPMHPESVALTASKMMLKRFKELLESKKSFAFETTAAGTNYVRHLKSAQASGYGIHLIFLWLSSSQLAIERVSRRTKQGGHNIPLETIIRRYYAGLKNLIKNYLPLSDEAVILDNSEGQSTDIIANKHISTGLIIYKQDIWNQIERASHVK